MTILISMYNFKGGVGKTTATHNIGYILSEVMGKKVLIVDADPQCNLTGIIHYNIFTGTPEKLEEYQKKREQDYSNQRYRTIFDLFRTFTSSQGVDLRSERADHVQIDEMKLAQYNNLYLMPGDLRVSRLDQAVTLGLANVPLYTGIPGYLTNIFRKIGEKHQFDFILFDLSPSLNGFNQAMLAGSDYFAIPFAPDFFSFQAVQTLTTEIPIMASKILKKFRSNHEDSLEIPEISYINTTPKFLGSFPQKVKTRNNMLEQVLGAWIKKVNLQTDLLIAELRKYHMVAEQFQFRKPVGVIDFATPGLDAQASGYPISDLNHKHKHIVRVDEKGKEEKKAFNPGQKSIKARVSDSYLKILAILLSNLSQEDLDLNFDAMAQQRIKILCNLSEGVDPQHFIPVSPSLQVAEDFEEEAESAADTRWYEDDDINLLMRHFFGNEDDIEVLDAISATQLGGETLAANLRDFEANKMTQNSRLLIPMNIGGRHWVLAYVRYYKETNITDAYYFDPLGQNIEANLERVLNQSLQGQVRVVNLDFRVQDDGVNCGPWIVEAARSLVFSCAIPEGNIGTIRNNFNHIIEQHHQAEARRARSARREEQRMSQGPGVSSAAIVVHRFKATQQSGQKRNTQENPHNNNNNNKKKKKKH